MSSSRLGCPLSLETPNMGNHGSHVLASDLYMQWVLVKTGRLEAQAVVQDLIDAEPGLWAPRA